MENGGKQYINFKNSDGDTPLYFACRKGEIDVIEYLLANGAKNTINNKLNDGNTLLHVFTELNESDIILLLLNYDANPFIKNNDNKLPIDLIAHNDRDSLIIRKALENAMN
jgi:ankyrin repeat protein